MFVYFLFRFLLLLSRFVGWWFVCLFWFLCRFGCFGFLIFFFILSFVWWCLCCIIFRCSCCARGCFILFGLYPVGFVFYCLIFLFVVYVVCVCWAICEVVAYIFWCSGIFVFGLFSCFLFVWVCLFVSFFSGC